MSSHDDQSPGPLVVFLGPSLPIDEARRVLDAVYLPPARQSDLLTAVHLHRPRAIGLVDGEFGQSLSVWHKEILYALERGVPVYGSSSMGALRAAETERFGMIGVGRIYEMYASGDLEDDDEVALAHASADDDWRPLSEPMVNVRATLARARDAGVLHEANHDLIVAAAKAVFFADRTWARVLKDAIDAGLDEATAEALRAFVRTQAVDQKREDALELLETLRELPTPVPVPEMPEPLTRSHLFETLYQRDRRVKHDGTEVPLAAIANWAALHRPDFHDLNVHALNRALVGVLADLMEVEASEADVADETTRFRRRNGLRTDRELDAWLDNNDLLPEELRELMHEQALARRLQRWLITRWSMRRTTKWVLDELRLRGDYPEVARAAAAQEAVLQREFPDLREAPVGEIGMRELLRDHLQETSGTMDADYSVWAEEAGFHSTEDLEMELLRARLARHFDRRIAREAVDALEYADDRSDGADDPAAAG